nr:MAG TPA: hypothetical protein [Caudoviricetes sp.]
MVFVPLCQFILLLEKVQPSKLRSLTLRVPNLLLRHFVTNLSNNKCSFPVICVNKEHLPSP